MPYRLSGAAAFFQRAEVRDLLAWLRLLVDPGDAGAVVRALARPPVELRGDRPRARAPRSPAGASSTWSRALAAALESPQIPPEARERIRTFLKLYRAAAARARLHAPRPLRAPADRAARAAPPAAVRRLDRGRRAAASTSPSSPSSPPPTCAARRRPPRASSPARSPPSPTPGCARRRRPPASAPRGVQVMTMHAAKGLEFDHVYVLGADGRAHAGPAPAHARADPRRAAQGDAPARLAAPAHVAEMRRLLHVAMTRARRRLVLAYPERTERGAAQQPSPFAEEARVGASAASGSRARRSCSARPRRCSRRSGCCATSC